MQARIRNLLLYISQGGKVNTVGMYAGDTGLEPGGLWDVGCGMWDVGRLFPVAPTFCGYL
jgi:hypothetical protein